MEPQLIIDGPTGPGSFRLIACPTLSHERRTDRYCTVGDTVGKSLRKMGWRTRDLQARVFIDGVFVPQAEWEFAMPTDGQAVVVRRIPTGGQGGGKQALQIVAMLALVVGAGYLGGASAAATFGFTTTLGIPTGQLLAAGLLLGGSLAINALIAPPRPRLSDLSGQNVSPTYSLTGASNQLTPYGRVPRVYGTHKMYPPLAAVPITEILGNNQYLRILFCLGYGPLVIDKLKIGDTDIQEFNKVPGDLDLEILRGVPTDPPLRIVTTDIVEDALSVKITQAGGWVSRTSAPNARELSIDFTFPKGLVQLTPEGGQFTQEVGFEVQYRKVGDSTWLTAGNTLGTKASVMTGFAGLNNDLVFTYRVPGPWPGNVYSIIFRFGSSLQVKHSSQYSQYELDSQGFKDYQVIIEVANGVTTAAQVKSACEANPVVNPLIEVTFANLDDGTGTIILASANFYPMHGGTGEIGTLVMRAASQTLVRKSVTPWPVPEPGAQYEVQVRRTTNDFTNVLSQGESYWTVLRTVQNSPPLDTTGLAFIEMRIKATDQLNGTVDTLNLVATSILPDWNGTIWEERPTMNPASIYRDVLQGTANRRPKIDAQLDLSTIQDFHERCAIQGFTFNAVIDFQTTVKQLRQDVLAAGRGTFGMRDMRYSVIQDLVQVAPVDLITPRTTSGFKWTRRFLELPHALKVRFVDADDQWRQAERIVYADGYDESNATEFEDTEAGLGVTNWTQARTLKRRELAEAQLRADDYEVQMDFANLNVTRGDRVQLQHDVILAGLITARIKTVTLNGGLEATAVTFDEPLVMGDGISYAARIRRADGVQVVQQIVTVIGEWTNATFSAPIPVASVPAIGDVVSFGELGRETLDCIVKGIEPGPDYTATLHLLDYAPAIQTAENQGSIPPYSSPLTIPSIVTVPTIVQVLSDETVLIRELDGSLQSRIVISVHFSSQLGFAPTRIETQSRPVDSDEDWKVIFSQIAGSSVEVPITPVQDGVTYEIRLRGMNEITGQISPWTAVIEHLVIGKSSPPPDVPMLVIEGTRLRWNYPVPPRDLAGFLVRFRSGTSRDWDSASPAHDQIILTTDFTILQQSAVQTYLVKAVDSSGNVSVNPATVTIDFGNQVLSNVIVEIDHRALGWPGTKTNGTVISGDLKAGSSSPFWTADSDLAWPLAAGDLYWVGSFGDMTYEWSVSPTLDLLDAVLKLDVQAQGDWRVDYRTDSTVLMWNADATTTMWNANAATPMWSAKGDYLAWPGQVAPILYQQYDFRFTGQSGGMQSVLQQLNVIFDVDDLTETFSNLALASIGTRLTLTQSYRGIVIVHVDLIDDGGTAAFVRVMDKSLSGPLLQAFDVSNVATTATVDVTVQGY